jgi:hypothetical protein
MMAFTNHSLNNRYAGLGAFGKGFNISSITRPIQSVTRAVTRPVTSVVRAVAKPVVSATQSIVKPVISEVKSVASNPLQAITTVINPAMGLTSELNKMATKIPVVGNVVGTVEKAATSLVSAVPIIGKPVSSIVGGALNIPGSVQSGRTVSQDMSPIYQDAQGNIITEAEYLRQMAQSDTVYQDAQGNIITEAQYNYLMSKDPSEGRGFIPSVQSTPNQMNYAPMYQSPSGQTVQPTESQTEPDNSDQPVAASTLDPLSQKVYDTLAKIREKVAAKQTLTEQENDFVSGISMAMKSEIPLSLIPNVNSIVTSAPKSFAGDFEWKMEGFGSLGTLPSFNRQRINFKGAIR